MVAELNRIISEDLLFRRPNLLSTALFIKDNIFLHHCLCTELIIFHVLMSRLKRNPIPTGHGHELQRMERVTC
ncbi:MAG: hypothetical protein D6820_02115 [Lentisphaerae bacterium]|nr:MAG: hypothetical protein D6820_02115 [Lentisphaerota bacterium]